MVVDGQRASGDLPGAREIMESAGVCTARAKLLARDFSIKPSVIAPPGMRWR
jgi:hypothetical protein